jgi:3-(3-hydroxy-phenyl)propionate hydroxylase
MPFPPLEKHFPMTNLQQSSMEELLVDRAERQPEIDLRWQSKLTDVNPEADVVRCSVETPAGDYQLCTPYLVACDGARSLVRERLGLRMEGYSSPGRYLIADIHLKSDHPTERRAWFDPPCNPGSTALMHKQPDDIWRVDFQILGSDSDEEELEEARVRERIRSLLEMIGETAPWELVWKSLYKAYGLALDSYRHGRVFFAGDAAHLVPIFGVRGLNSGFADANNLGWKLAYHARGLAPSALLDSYDFERRAATHDILRQAEKSTIFMTPPSEGYRIMRDATLSLAIRHEFARGLIDPRQSVPYDYLESPVNSFDEAEPTPTLGPRTGAPLPNLRLDGALPRDWQPRHLLDVMGPHFTALQLVDDPNDTARMEALEKALLEAPVPCQLVTITPEEPVLEGRKTLLDAEHHLSENLGAVDGCVILVRPDAHVCARLRAPSPERLLAALQRALTSDPEPSGRKARTRQ